GYMRHVLVLAGEKMTHLPTKVTTRILAEVIDRNERRYGASMPALAAMITQKYRHDHALTKRHMQDILAAVAMKNHGNGALNPYAQFQKPITKEKYLESKLVADPLRVYDCAPITDGAAALILSADPGPVKVIGMGQATDTIAVGRRGSLTSFNSTKKAAKRAYQMAGIGPGEIDFAEVHDAFTTFEIIGTEDLGFFKPGKGWRALLEGKTALHGPKPINPSGGLKARGHPVGASGLAQIVEIYWQLKGDLPAERRVPQARIGLAQSIGGLANNNFVTILERADNRRAGPESVAAVYQPTITDPGKMALKREFPGHQGRLITYTTLYATPEGFPTPLTMGFVKTDRGKVVLAHHSGHHYPTIGQRVVLTNPNGLLLFKKFTI
ncbi:MAG: thiolase family protein, partial [Deltaproteobacteria bacterium]|nr:thiolase family protein [Deltaproteobacteria bacterium]